MDTIYLSPRRRSYGVRMSTPQAELWSEDRHVEEVRDCYSGEIDWDLYCGDLCTSASLSVSLYAGTAHLI